MTPRGGPLLLMVSPPHRCPTDFGQTLPQHEAGRATDCQGPQSNLHFIPHSRAPPVVCITIIQPGMGFKTLSFFSPVSGGPPERPVALTCVAQTGVVSPGGDEQATRYYPPSLIRARV